MDHQRIMAGALALLLCMGAFAGCGTSHRSQLESSEKEVEEVEHFAPEPSPVVSADDQPVVLPELERPQQQAGERDVTEQYKNSFLGLWDTEDGTEIFEFKINENLVRWRADGSAGDSYTYWFQEDDAQPRLYLFRNGEAEAEVYSFTCGPDSISLLSPDSGDAQYRLTRRTDAIPTQETVLDLTPAPQETAASAPAETPDPTAAPSARPPEPAESASPSAAPAQSPEPSPSPAPTAEPSPTPTPELSESVQKAMPAIACAMDVVLSGYGFDPEDENSYWAIMVRYLSGSRRGDEADGRFSVSREQLETASREVFADFSEIPRCPADAPYVTEERGEDDTVSYRILWGEPADCELTVLSCESGGVRLSVGGGAVYQIEVEDTGAILSVTEE